MKQEILIGKIKDRKYNEGLREMEVVKTYHIYKLNKNIYIDAPIKVSVLNRIRKALRYNYISYDNIIIGDPDI